MKKLLSYAGLTLVFITILFAYGRYFFNGATWLLEHLWSSEFYWKDAPLLHLVLRMGVGGALSWIITIGVRNRFRKRPFLDTVNWQKLLVVVFCLCLLLHLNNEVDALVPRLAAIDFEFDPDHGSGNPLA
ncbi:MAG: hypothetical protein ISS31_10865 [Kiritimatiellae bacterium]|nr:hypothetical protein [Kiritimatiellia bacterium]